MDKLHRVQRSALDVGSRPDGWDAEYHIADAICFPLDFRYDPGGAWWWEVVDEGGALVAYAGIKNLGNGVWYLCRAGVLPSRRRRGLGRRLLRARVRFARSQGARMLITNCIPENVSSANNLLTGGFRLYRPQSLWAGASSLYWRLDLSADPDRL